MHPGYRRSRADSPVEHVPAPEPAQVFIYPPDW
jgi:hypothetical protein